jgi:preprotein translocase subunit SecA
MHREAEQVVDRSLKLRHVADGKLRERLGHIQSYYRRQRKGFEEILPDALSMLCEISDRTLGLRPHPVQILGAMALHSGYLAEMATGEGKSLTACFPAILTAWTGSPCHIITVNDYLAARDADEMRPFYTFSGVSVGCVSSVMDHEERRMNYDKGVVYTTSKEILADFLRDRLRLGRCHQPSRRLISHMLRPMNREREALVMRGIDTAIVDEADSVLIDEAVTPLIISHPQENDHLLKACRTAHEMAETLTSYVDYHAELKYREISLTNSGAKKIEALCRSLPGLWQGTARREELVIQALTAREFYHRDRQYVVQDDKVVIVDEFTGRLMPGRTWKHGLHQAVEAREGLELSDPTETLARLSFQRFFRFFRKLSGMSGTAGEAADEFWDVYCLPVLSIPTHRPCIRKQLPDRVFSNNEKKWKAIVEEIDRMHQTGRPILAGTRNVRASEKLARMLEHRGLPFNLLNAIRHREEAAIVAAAGKYGAITIATNMAGRGTDIKLGRGVANLGGLHVIATERHESSRIDRQLFGRCARQGDPGSTQAFPCIDDELFERFMPAPMRSGLSSIIERQIPGAQNIAEGALSFSQKAAQRLAFRQRRGVLQMDTWLEDALSFSGSGMEI